MPNDQLPTSLDDGTTLCGLVHTRSGRWQWYIGDLRSVGFDHRSQAMSALREAIGYRYENGWLGRWGMGADIIESSM